MPSTKKLITKLRTDFPELHFEAADDFLWSPNQKTIFFDSQSSDYPACLFHELAHSVLGHADYGRDIELVKMESEAWHEAVKLAHKYSVIIDENWIQDMLDTYRDWLHQRSTCPKCQASGIQKEQKKYHCVACSHTWRVNDAKNCGLKRYSLNK